MTLRTFDSGFPLQSTYRNPATSLASHTFICWTGMAELQLCSSQRFALLKEGERGACAEEGVRCCLGAEMSRKLLYKGKWKQAFCQNAFLSVF